MLEKKHEEYREKIRAFALEKIEPLAVTLDLEQRFPTEHITPMTEMGLMSMLIPEQYGGHPIDTRHAMRSRSKNCRVSAARPASRSPRTIRSGPGRSTNSAPKSRRRNIFRAPPRAN